MQRWKGLGGYYHRRLGNIYAHAIPAGQKVLELGCGQGDLLAAVQPAFGVGVDFSYKMLAEAHKKHPALHFIQADAHEALFRDTQFDFIILSDLLNDSWDVQTIFECLTALCGPQTRILINTYSRLWEIPLAVAAALRLAWPVLYQNWLTIADITNLLTLAGFEPISTGREVMFPLYIPGISAFFNRFLVRFWPFYHLGLANFILARPAGVERQFAPSVSIIIPARNEAGNIESIFQSLPRFAEKMDLIFVEGNSTDHTDDAIRASMAAHPEMPGQLLKQSGVGKGDAVRRGFEAAQGDILMILDSDLAVPPATLPRFYEAIMSGRGEFINGVRLVYPMEKEAMQYFNLLGNKFFSLLFSWLLGQPIKDTLCGTKVLWRKDYQRIARGRAYFGDFDPFGDFDLLFGAARLKLKMVDLPVRYRRRVYGETNIQRWKHGALLLRMAAFAAWRLKFI
jgi:SAM-dependent methyltransferase